MQHRQAKIDVMGAGICRSLRRVSLGGGAKQRLGRRHEPHSFKFAADGVVMGLAPSALASTTWYVNGVNGSDSHICKSATVPCKTIGHAITLASSGDSIKVAAATYKENFSIGKSLNLIGSGVSTTIIDGGGRNTVVTISNTSVVTLSHLTITNGSASSGGGISNLGHGNDQQQHHQREYRTQIRRHLRHGYAPEQHCCE